MQSSIWMKHITPQGYSWDLNVHTDALIKYLCCPWHVLEQIVQYFHENPRISTKNEENYLEKAGLNISSIGCNFFKFIGANSPSWMTEKWESENYTPNQVFGKVNYFVLLLVTLFAVVCSSLFRCIRFSLFCPAALVGMLFVLESGVVCKRISKRGRKKAVL